MFDPPPNQTHPFRVLAVVLQQGPAPAQLPVHPEIAPFAMPGKIEPEKTFPVLPGGSPQATRLFAGKCLHAEALGFASQNQCGDGNDSKPKADAKHWVARANYFRDIITKALARFLHRTTDSLHPLRLTQTNPALARKTVWRFRPAFRASAWISDRGARGVPADG